MSNLVLHVDVAIPEMRWQNIYISGKKLVAQKYKNKLALDPNSQGRASLVFTPALDVIFLNPGTQILRFPSGIEGTCEKNRKSGHLALNIYSRCT